MKKESNTHKRGNKPNPTNLQKIMKYSEGKGLDGYKFNYNINVNQYAVLKNGWELDFIDIAIFLSIYNFISSGSADRYKITDSNNINWYYVSDHKIIKDLPLIPINSPTALVKRITKLCTFDLIVRNPDNRVNAKKYIRIGKGAEKYFYNSSSNINVCPEA